MLVNKNIMYHFKPIAFILTFHTFNTFCPEIFSMINIILLQYFMMRIAVIIITKADFDIVFGHVFPGFCSMTTRRPNKL